MRLELPPVAASARVWVAYSGGLDSTVLLHRLHAQGVANLRAIHVHHGLQASADDWVRHARRVCRALGVPLSVRRVQVQAVQGEGPEAAARCARHAALQSVLRPDDLLVTAHHRDDQAETVLMRALRGSGVSGLAAMSALRDLPRGRLWRPLLAFSRPQLRAYAERHALDWIEDPHNTDPRYARSWLRSAVLPQLHQHWPQAEASLARLAGHAADAAELLQALGDADLAAARDGEGWRISTLLALSPARRRNALHRLYSLNSAVPGQVPGSVQVAQLEQTLLRARADTQPLLRDDGGEWRRYRDHLYRLSPLPAVPRDWHQPWAGRGCLQLPEACGRLQAERRAPAAAFEAALLGPGEHFQPLQAGRRRSLKNLFQEAGVPPWQRLRTPVLRLDGRLVWVGGVGWAADAGSCMRKLDWQRS